MTKPTRAVRRADGHPIRIRLTCDLPSMPPGTVFGLQDQAGRLVEGRLTADGSLAFEGEVHAVRGADGSVSLRGPIVHGTPAARFLYLSCRPARSGPAPWLFRLKVPLAGIDPDAAVVEARIQATGGGSVPLLGDGWTVVGSSAGDAAAPAP
jgi:hypothetical protein